MVNPTNPEELILKTKRYEFADGLRDIQIGIIFILMGSISWLMFNPAWIRLFIRLKDNFGAWTSWLVFLLLFLIPVFFALGFQRFIEYVRRRWLWRESGMIKSSRAMVPPLVTLVSVIVFVLILVTGLALRPVLASGEFYVFSLIFLAAGWSFGITLTWFGYRIQLNRYVYLGIIGGLATTPVLLFQTSLVDPPLYFSLLWGTILLITGFVILQQAWAVFQENSNVR